MEAGILGGITRGLLLEKIAPAAGVRTTEAILHPSDLTTMSECFLLSSTKDITPVCAIDDLRFDVGPQTVSARLKAAFAAYMQAYVESRPELKV